MSRYQAAIDRFPTIRQSRGVQFDACALSMKLNADYRADWSGHPQVRGQIMHRVLADALTMMGERGEAKIPRDAMGGILLEHLRQDDIDRDCPDCGAEIVRTEGGQVVCVNNHRFASNFGNIPLREVKDMRWVAGKWADEFPKWMKEHGLAIDDLYAVEERLHGTLAYIEPDGSRTERTITGQLDAWWLVATDHAVVLDWKDTWSLPPQTDAGFDGYAQQRWYSLLLMMRHRFLEKITTFEYYLRYGEAREATIYRYEVDQLERELSVLVERFDRAWTEGKFPPSPAAHCQRCPRPAACPIFPGVRAAGQITDEETARRRAGEALVAKSVVKQLEEALRAWADVRGPIPIRADAGRERVWGFVQHKRTSRPTRAELERAIYSRRVNLDELYKVTTQTKFEQAAPQRAIDDTADDAALMSALDQSLKGKAA